MRYGVTPPNDAPAVERDVLRQVALDVCTYKLGNSLERRRLRLTKKHFFASDCIEAGVKPNDVLFCDALNSDCHDA